MATLDNMMEYLADKISLIGKTLTMSNNSWTSGSCTITDSSKYRVFIIWAGTPCLGIRYDNQMYAFGLAGGASAVYTRAFDCTVSGDTWTIAQIIQLGHTASSNHGAKATPTITNVIGLIPFTD